MRRKDFDTELAAYDETIATVDQMLRLCASVREAKPRDPLRAIEDSLLEIRAAVADGALGL
jgi:hypothetical protein